MERRAGETGIEICCAAKPGLLLSTVQTLEALGLDIQHCVISCFNDFAIQASCSEACSYQFFFFFFFFNLCFFSEGIVFTCDQIGRGAKTSYEHRRSKASVISKYWVRRKMPVEQI